MKDVTEDYAKKYPENQKFPNNQKVLNVDGKVVFISMETDETVEGVIEKEMDSYSSPLIDFVGLPHLYRKGNLLARYFGNDEKLLNILQYVLGKSYIN